MLLIVMLSLTRAKTLTRSGILNSMQTTMAKGLSKSRWTTIKILYLQALIKTLETAISNHINHSWSIIIRRLRVQPFQWVSGEVPKMSLQIKIWFLIQIVEAGNSCKAELSKLLTDVNRILRKIWDFKIFNSQVLILTSLGLSHSILKIIFQILMREAVEVLIIFIKDLEGMVVSLVKWQTLITS